jgi:hypothetical protein
MYRVFVAGRANPFITESLGIAEHVSQLYDGARIQVLDDNGRWVSYE